MINRSPICLIKPRRLTFEYDSQTYKGFRKGDYITISDYNLEYMYSSTVQITGFNPDHAIIHWKAVTRLGGFIHSESMAEECKKL